MIDETKAVAVLGALRARLEHPDDETEPVVEGQDLRVWRLAGADLVG